MSDPRRDLEKIMEQYTETMILLTCVTYLRPHCSECMVKHYYEEELDRFMESVGDLMHDDLPQFLRQLVINAKERTEERLIEHTCPRGSLKEVVEHEREKLTLAIGMVDFGPDTEGGS